MRADFGGFSYLGTVVKFCAPWFRVVFSDGDSADYTGLELAPLLDFSENDFYDPRLWFYDFSVIDGDPGFSPRLPHVRRGLRPRPAPNLVQRSGRCGGAT